MTLEKTSQLSSQVLNGEPVKLTFHYNNREINRFLNSLFTKILSHSDMLYLQGTVENILREMIVNAVKANTKRIHFIKNNLNIEDPLHYQEGMASFKTYLISSMDELPEELKQKGYKVELVLKKDNNGLKIIVRNNSALLPLEQERIQLRVDKAREYKFGGIDQSSLAFLLQVKDLFVYLGGNLDSLGGLSPMADTLGQDQMLAQNASKRVAHMQSKVVDFTNRVINSLGFYLWTDPLINLPLTKSVPGMENISVSFTLDAQTKEGDFIDYNISIDPYSMQHQSPQMKLQTITQVFSQFIIPFAPMMAEQGIGVNFEALMKIIGKYANVNELNDILEFTQSQGQFDRPMVGRLANKQAVTRHISERVNRPGATRSGKDSALMQTLLGGRPQGSEMAAIGRPVS